MTKMVKCKILVAEKEYDHYGDYVSQAIAGHITDWDEISEDDFGLLVRNLYKLSANYDGQLILVKYDDVPIAQRISDIVNILKKEEQKRAKEIADRKAREEENRIKKQAKKLENDKKALQKLLADNPELLDELITKT